MGTRAGCPGRFAWKSSLIFSCGVMHARRTPRRRTNVRRFDSVEKDRSVRSGSTGGGFVQLDQLAAGIGPHSRQLP